MDISGIEKQLNRSSVSENGSVSWEITPKEARKRILKQSAMGFVIGAILLGIIFLFTQSSRVEYTFSDKIAILPYAPIIAGVITAVWAIARMISSRKHRFYTFDSAGVKVRTKNKSAQFAWSDFESYSSPDAGHKRNSRNTARLETAITLQAIDGVSKLTTPTFYLRLKQSKFSLTVRLVVIETKPEVVSAVQQILEQHLAVKELIGLKFHKFVWK